MVRSNRPLSKHLDNLIVRGRRAITPSTALMLSRALDTSPEFWMNLQTNYDLALELQRQRKRA